ncbi:MAG: 4Fe-4S ferredoxin [Nitrospira bacterium SG8_3]|nr:MAG: 4Fe-4S ferredoxin [Nitrospira bacterium SG8_3]
MRIVRARQISQVFFFLLFLWFCVVASVGEAWWQLRGWPVNWLLQLDPLVALGTILTTRTLYAGLLWALVTVVLTILFGRFFCSWVCPFGTLHHLVGYLGTRGKTLAEKAARNQYHGAQSVKYVLLIFLLGAAVGELLARLTHPLGLSPGQSRPSWVLLILALLVLLFLSLRKLSAQKLRTAHWMVVGVAVSILLACLLSGNSLVGASLQTGLLDPIPLIHRSVNLVILPLVDGATHKLAISQRFTLGAWLIGAVFLAAVLLNLRAPRFYCRFVCPLGALFGVLSRYALWRVGKNQSECSQCARCEGACEGACEPSANIRISECVLCMKCLDVCHEDLIGYRTTPSESGEVVSPDLSRRGFVISLLSGVAAVPVARLGGALGTHWSPMLIRPPGALTEEDFLKRCIKCGQCMRICPTNIDFRVGTSGCQYNCIACGHVCPTAAIRPITVDEKQGKNAFASAGPIRVGAAFVDRGRCLPWAMDKPCIVCQENCPVSPKAIFTREHFSPVRAGPFMVTSVQGVTVTFQGGDLRPGALATGDYVCHSITQEEQGHWKILENTERVLVLSPDPAQQRLPEPGDNLEIQIRLKQPHVDIGRCIGCGICEHECPVSGQRAIRVTAENESRSKEHTLLLS